MQIKISLARTLLLVSVAGGFSACVSSSKFNKSQEELAASQAHVSELESKLGVTSSAKTKLEGSVAEMKNALEELRKRKAESDKRIAEFRDLTSKFQSLVDAGKLSVNIVNGRMVVALSTDVLFGSGSASLSKDGRSAIKEVTSLLVDLQGKKFQIEGHTDNVPIKTAVFPTNWELASARSISVVKSMLDAGMPPERISAASYAEYAPAKANDSKENRASNRRIEIVIVPDLSSLPGFDELQKMAGNNAAGAPAPKGDAHGILPGDVPQRDNPKKAPKTDDAKASSGA